MLICCNSQNLIKWKPGASCFIQVSYTGGQGLEPSLGCHPTCISRELFRSGAARIQNRCPRGVLATQAEVLPAESQCYSIKIIFTKLLLSLWVVRAGLHNHQSTYCANTRYYKTRECQVSLVRKYLVTAGCCAAMGYLRIVQSSKTVHKIQDILITADR